MPRVNCFAAATTCTPDELFSISVERVPASDKAWPTRRLEMNSNPGHESTVRTGTTMRINCINANDGLVPEG